jgi:glycosyltransferase involved in cell wall biosynthesis
MSEFKPLLSLVILCYKEGSYIPIFVKETKETLKQAGIPFKLILVANYYPDTTNPSSLIVQQLAKRDPDLLAVTLPKKGKMGWDLRSGFNAARGEIVGFIDGDGQIAPADVVRAYNQITNGENDMVLGQRIERRDGLIRKITSRTHAFILRCLFPRVRIWDINGKPKLFIRERLKELRLTSNNWFADAEIVLQATYRNFKINTIPTIFYENERSPTTTSVWSILETLRDLIKYRWQLFFNKKRLLS